MISNTVIALSSWLSWLKKYKEHPVLSELNILQGELQYIWTNIDSIELIQILYYKTFSMRKLYKSILGKGESSNYFINKVKVFSVA